MELLPRPRSIFYGQLLTAGAVVAQFAQFAMGRQFRGEWGEVLVFAGGALYALLGIPAYTLFFGPGGRRVSFYFIVQYALLAGMAIELDEGMLFIALPVLCQTVEALHWRRAAILTVGLFAVCVGARWMSHGAAAGFAAAGAYAGAFAFVIVLTSVTGQAVAAQERAERLGAELEAANVQLRAYAAQAAELATARERNRLAREIHDGLGHYLTVINVQLEAARATAATAPAQSAAALDTAARLSREMLADVRRSVGSLRAEAARPPLPAAVRAMADDAGVPLALRVEGIERPLPPEAEHALYRCAQEGLTNVRKHAAATQVDVTLDFRAPKRVALVIADNGRGQSTGNGGGSGFGLRGLRERIESLGGRITAANGPQGGFLLSVDVPA